MTNEGFVLLFEAVMEQAYKDLEDNNEEIRKDAERYIEKMKKDFQR